MDFETEYIKRGFALWINNLPIEAEQHFRKNIGSTKILSGYAFILCVNGIISYEMDKINEAQAIFKDLQKRCYQSQNWLNTIKNKLFGSNNSSNNINSSAILLEEQIILADSYISLAILIFIKQDITGLMKGSWLLRKAWKIYQNVYTKLYELYKKEFSDQQYSPPTPLNYVRNMPRSISLYHNRWSTRHHSRNYAISNLMKFSISEHENNQSNLPENLAVNYNIDKNTAEALYYSSNSSNKIYNCQASSCSTFETSSIDPTSSRLTNRPEINSSLDLDLKHISDINFTMNTPLSCPNSGTSAYSFGQHSSMNRNDDYIEPDTIKRLMGAVSFGYGLFQLSASLLPANLLRIVNFLGFEGNRELGLKCLEFSQLSYDMRSTWATFALLFYYTYGNELFQFEDGNNENDLKNALYLLNGTYKQYLDSAIFLFFYGRVERMLANIPKSIRYYKVAYKRAAQRELKILCLHEIAWCNLIQLNFSEAFERFDELRKASTFSTAFYSYMTAICDGATGNYIRLNEYRTEIINDIATTDLNIDLLKRFITNRITKFPVENDPDIKKYNAFYWKFLIYEVLYLWSTFNSLNRENLQKIIEDCSDQNCVNFEPIIGIQKLILGNVLIFMKQHQNAVTVLKECIAIRDKTTANDVHVSAFAHFELAILLLRCTDDYTKEGKKLLEDASRFIDYDFDVRLCVRIQKELKKLHSTR